MPHRSGSECISIAIEVLIEQHVDVLYGLQIWPDGSRVFVILVSGGCRRSDPRVCRCLDIVRRLVLQDDATNSGQS